MSDFFPNGWSTYLQGGLAVGLATGLVFLLTGIRAGASGVFTTTWTWIVPGALRVPERLAGERGWRALFSVGLVLGAGAMVLAGVTAEFRTEVQPWRLLVGGFLVGIGTRLGRGCTSGHGICGISSGSRSSIVAVVVFLGVAIGTAHAVEALGVRP